MKKFLILSAAIMLLGISNSKALVVATNILADATTPAFLVLPTGASVYNVELTATQPVLVKFYDQNTLAAPFFGTNYTNGGYVSVSTYPTNIVTSFVGYNGVTNWYTNTGQFTYYTTNAGSTNILPLMGAFVVGANSMAVYNVDQLHRKGIVITANTNVSIVINYTRGQ